MKKENTSIRLKRLMEDRKLKQVDILDITKPYCIKYDVKMNKSDISQYVSGKVEPTQDKLFVLAKALGVNVACHYQREWFYPHFSIKCLMNV